MTIAPVRLTVPGNHLMPGLLGQNDKWLELIEKRFPETDILVRGNEIVVTGDRSATVARLFEEMITLLQRGLRLDAARAQLDLSAFDRIIGSLHTIPLERPSADGEQSADGVRTPRPEHRAEPVDPRAPILACLTCDL